MMCEMIIGKTVDEAMKITNIDVEQALRDEDATAAIPPQKMHCSVMAYDVIRKAASQYKGVDMDSLEEEEIVCQCARVSLRTVRDVIRINDLKTVEEITRFTKAGAFCKSCIRPGGHESRPHYLVDILRDVRAEMESGSRLPPRPRRPSPSWASSRGTGRWRRCWTRRSGPTSFGTAGISRWWT